MIRLFFGPVVFETVTIPDPRRYPSTKFCRYVPLGPFRPNRIRKVFLIVNEDT